MSSKTSSDFHYYKIAIVIMMLIVITICMVMMVSPQIAAQKEADLIRQDVILWQERIVHLPQTQPSSPTTGDPETDAAIPVQEKPFRSLYDAMDAYNKEIYAEGQEDLEDAWSYQADVFDLRDYGIDSKIAAIVTIPKLNVTMPLYLGASWANLNEGFAQLSETSMPIGGENTNCVIAGHRGWRDMDFLINIEQLRLGDSVFIQNFWETLEYRVCDIQIIYPHEVEKVHIQPGRDLITFVTCHPYRVNSHRYVVVCERFIPEEEPDTSIATEPSANQPDPAGTEPQVPTVEWANRITITASNGIDFHSSQMLIFLNKKLPWICLAASIGLIAGSGFILCIRRFLSDRKQ